MSEQKRPVLNWMDVLWLLFLAGLAALPPVGEIHKQLTLLAIGVVQFSEGWLLARAPRRGAAYIVLLKIALATLLIDHTGEVGINSSYYPIFYVPIVTAAEYFSPWGTLLWTALASAAYCSYLYPALQEYEITTESYGLLAIRILFFFLAAMVVNRFVVENRRQIKRYQELAETLAETNKRLEQAQAEARRSERLAGWRRLRWPVRNLASRCCFTSAAVGMPRSCARACSARSAACWRIPRPAVPAPRWRHC